VRSGLADIVGEIAVESPEGADVELGLGGITARLADLGRRDRAASPIGASHATVGGMLALSARHARTTRLDGTREHAVAGGRRRAIDARGRHPDLEISEALVRNVGEEHRPLGGSNEEGKFSASVGVKRQFGGCAALGK